MSSMESIQCGDGSSWFVVRITGVLDRPEIHASPFEFNQSRECHYVRDLIEL